jgi:hypothetical protein
MEWMDDEWREAEHNGSRFIEPDGKYFPTLFSSPSEGVIMIAQIND